MFKDLNTMKKVIKEINMEKILTYKSLLNVNQLIVEQHITNFDIYGYNDGAIFYQLLNKLNNRIKQLEDIIIVKCPEKINLDKTKSFKLIITDYQAAIRDI